MLAQKAVAGAEELAQAKGKCVHCANAAERICQRCGDFYCSKHCQRQDWLRHRYICIPLPALVSPNEYSVFQSDGESTLEGACSLNADKSVVEASPTPLSRLPILPDLQCNNAGSSSIIAAKNDIPVSPPSGVMVYITNFISSNRCYIRKASKSAEQAFDEVCKKVNTTATILPRINNPPPNGWCLAHVNGRYLRAKICKEVGGVSYLFLVDLGIKQPGPFSDLKAISDELIALPCSSQLVQLKNVLKCDYSNDVIAFNSQFVGKKYMATFKKGPGIHLVELVNTKMNFSVNEQLKAFFNSKKLLRNPKSVAENKKSCSLEGPQPSLVDERITIPAIESKPEMQNECEEILKQQDSGQIDQSKSTKVLVTEGASNKALGFIALLADEATKTDQDTAPKPKDEDVKHCLTPKANYPLQLPSHKLNLELPSIHKTNAQTNGIVMPKNERVLQPPFEMRRLSIESKEGIDLIVVDSSKKNRGIFGAFDSKYASEFHALNSWLLIRDCEPYKPVVKEYVLARFQGSWNRGKVEQIIVVPQQQTKYRVMFLDFTNVGDVTEVDIRRYPSDFTVPCSTNLCVIDEFPHNPNAAQVSYLAEVLKVHQLVHIDSVKYLNNIAVIKSESLIQKLLSL
ncbi:uncharacterized protein LOC117143522 [Drosophila mauritiana]|uniref:Uncharacterized protein LOC117143522 n=1 Tax=Drosophila mauritiana TaxID=7226 RepID=A0A6P8KL84_DROMA|nr:uncharacterized protein LOC117143522 [Drosophila mauritiana]